MNRTYLPILLDLTDSRVLVVGAGKAGAQKLKALAELGLRVTAVSPEFHRDLEGVTYFDRVQRPFEDRDLDAAAVVMICTNDPVLNDHIAALAKARGILVNHASSPEKGHFISPAILKKGPYFMAISASGTGPRKAVYLRDTLSPTFLNALSTLEEK